jgi:hypothetical protein
MSPLAVSPYQDLEPDRWRGLLARGAVFHASRGVLDMLCDVAEQRDVQLALLQLYSVAEHVSRNCDDDDDVVASVARGWEEELDRTIERIGDADARDLLVKLKEHARSASSADPFDLIFQAVQAQARALYGPFWRPATLSLAHTLSYDPAMIDPYAVLAKTRLAVERAVIELQIFCDEFGPAAFAVLPILLTHEFVCHVPARQDKVKNDSEFAEGLLDWAAYFFLDQWAEKVDRQLAPAALRHAERLKHVLDHHAFPGIHARRLGHRAARNLRGWFQSECALSSNESRTRVARLAVELNQDDRPLNAKDRFVATVSWHSIPPKLEAALRSWVVGETSAGQLLDVA